MPHPNEIQTQQLLSKQSNQIKTREIFEKIKSGLTEFYEPTSNLPQTNINYDIPEIEISQMTERTYKCIKFQFNPQTNKLSRTYLEEFVNEVGFEPIIDEQHYEVEFPYAMREIYELFVLN